MMRTDFRSGFRHANPTMEDVLLVCDLVAKGVFLWPSFRSLSAILVFTSPRQVCLV